MGDIEGLRLLTFGDIRCCKAQGRGYSIKHGILIFSFLDIYSRLNINHWFIKIFISHGRFGGSFVPISIIRITRGRQLLANRRPSSVPISAD